MRQSLDAARTQHRAERVILAIEALEKTAKLVIVIFGMAVRALSQAVIADLNTTFRLR